MKKIFALSLLLLASIVQAQELITHQLFSPQSSELTDLDFFKAELQDKQLVMLGEKTHMYGNIFEMKARVIEYLHQELGFTTIAMESSMYDIWKMNETNKTFNADAFNDAVFGVWGTTKEFQRLVNYIETHNLKVVGFDSQIGNTNQFIDDLFDFLEGENINLEIDEDDLAIVIEGVLDDYSFEEFDIKFSKFEKEINRILNKIETLEKTETNFYWLQFVKNLFANAQDAYKNEDEIASLFFVNHLHNIRDEQMADNMLSYLERNPNEKVVIWADNIHIMNSSESINEPIMKDFISMGSHIKKALGAKVYSLATLHANDSLFQSQVWHQTPIQNPSFEALLKSMDSDFTFISANQEAVKQPQAHRLLSFVNFTESRLDLMHDGYIFFKYAEISNPNIDEIEHTIKEEYAEVLADTTRATKSKIGKTTYIKGKIIDSETQTPVSYANLILKDEAIYRIADEDGYFEIPLYINMKPDALVSISSMGFTTKDIALNQLSATVQLTPNVESLNEVLIIAHRSAKSVLNEAIKKIDINHPTTPFNYQRYSRILWNKNDETLLDIDLITDEYDQGYRQLNRLTQRLEQIKWNQNKLGKQIKNTRDLFNYRQNALRYSNILHRRKYKKFELNFIKSKAPEDEGLYIIEFKTERNKWNYTNRDYPTVYKGKVYINKVDLAIVKVIENWETTLNESEIKDQKNNNVFKNHLDNKEIKLKEEAICIYTKHTDGKYYASNYFRRSYTDFIDKKDRTGNLVFEFNSSLYNIETNNVEVIDYDYYKKDESLLKRVKYDENFWSSFTNETYLNLK